MSRRQRILVYGVTGSGKSTAALRLGEVTGLPVTLADEVCWQPGWVLMPEDQQRRVFADLTAQDAWVLDTAYSSWLDLALERADLIVCLDYPRWFSFQRLLRRSVARSIDKRVICNGNTESFRLLLRRDSILIWHASSFSRKRGRMRAWAAAGDGPEVRLFSRPRDLEAWLLSLG